jgi:hypothetical protein
VAASDQAALGVRLSGELSIAEPVRARLCELRLLEGVDTRPEIDLDAVRDLERAVDARLPDAILALFAARVPALEALGVGVEKVMGLTGRLHALGARGDLVALARLPAGSYLAWSKGDAAVDDPPLVCFDPAGRTEDRVSLVAFLEDRVRALRAEHPGAPAFDPGLAVTFVPRTVMPLPGGSDGRRVRHPHFGEGRVLLEKGRGERRKVQVDFPGHGLKTIQARFLTFLDEDER